MSAFKPSPAEQRRQLIGATIGNMVGITPAVTSVFGLFLIPLSQAFGWKRAEISGVLGVVAIGAAVMTPIAGRLADRYGPRRLLMLGNLVFAIMIGLLALGNGSLLLFYLDFAGIAAASAFVSTPLMAKAVSDWFDEHRGVAFGFSLGFGNGFGATLLPALAAIAVGAGGWRYGYLTIAALVLLLGAPSFLLLVRDSGLLPAAVSTDTAVRIDGLKLREAAKTRAFWLIIVAIAPAAGCVTAIFSHIIPILAERGISITIATSVLAVLALGTAAWQIAIGFIFDRVPTPRIIPPAYLAAICGILLLHWGVGTPALIAAGALIAIGLGTQFAALPYLIGRYFGMASFATILGVTYSAVYVLQGLTPVLFDHAFDVQGTYRFAILAICGSLAVTALLLLFLPPYRYGISAEPAATMLHA